MFKFADRPLSIVDIYKHGFVFYKDVFSKVWYLIFAGLVVNGIAEFVVSDLINPMHKALDKLLPSQLLVIGVLGLVGFLITLFFAALAMYRIYSFGSSNPNEKVSSCFSSALVVLKKWFELISVELLVWAAVMFGLLALLLPGIFLLVLLMFCVPVVLFENAGVFRSIKRSCQLVWGNWWRTFVVLLLPGIIFVSGAVLRAFVQSLNKGILVDALFDVFYIVFFTFLFGLVHTFVLVQYNDLRLRKS